MMADDLVYRNEVLGALLEAGQKSRRYKLGDIWELNFDEIRDAIATVQSAQPTDCIPMHVVINAITKIIRGAHPIEVIHQIWPSAQQDTPTVTYGLGKWIEKEDDAYHGGGYAECSVCGHRYSWGGYFEANGFRYCPRCGHRMEAKE